MSKDIRTLLGLILRIRLAEILTVDEKRAYAVNIAEAATSGQAFGLRCFSEDAMEIQMKSADLPATHGDPKQGQA